MLRILKRGLRVRQYPDGTRLSRRALASAYRQSSTRPAIYFNLTLASLLLLIAPVRHFVFGLPFFPTPLAGLLEWGVMVPASLAVAYVHARAGAGPRVDHLLGLLIGLGFVALQVDTMIWREFGIPIPHEYSALFFIAAISVAGLSAGTVLALSALFLPIALLTLLLPGTWSHMASGFSFYFDLVAVGLAILNARSLRKEAGLSWSLNERLARVNEDLANQVGETRAAFNKLKDAQAQLVQAEKLASLGGLVAGVAHEINTPIGVGVLAASTLRDDMAQMASALAGGTLNRSRLNAYVAGAEQASGMILSNLNRASELIGSFKRVAVDREGVDAEELVLADYVGEVLTSLRPQLRATPHRLELRCPPGLTAALVPGALAQILTNLVMNALTHAFNGVAHGLIVVAVEPPAPATDGQLLLRVSDNGTGIPPEVLPRVFDPFFTTRRGSGGSGLGLHVVFNLVHQTLGGTIEAHSVVGEGSTFLIRLPGAAVRQPARGAPALVDAA